MRERLEQRLEELKAEFECGQKVLADLDERRANVRDTLLRISGAVQSLEEILRGEAEDNADVRGADATAATRPAAA